MKTNIKQILSSWIWVVFYSFIIFLTIPVALNIQRFIAKKLGKNVFIYFVLSVAGLAFFALLYFLILKLKVRSPLKYIWLFCLTGLYTYCILKIGKSPAESIHFIEYGLLGFFVFGALKHNIKDKSIYFTATLFCLFIGTFDEILQWIIPGRFWGLRDVGLNALSSGLFLLGVWKVIDPKTISEKFKLKSLRKLSTVLISYLILLGLCVSNTPQRVASYTKVIPWLSFLQKEESMSEFGYRYKDPEIGFFYSRLNPMNLQKLDRQKGNEYAQLLNNSKNIEYKQFIREYNPISAPFVHELRAHIFRRDTYFKRGKNTANLNEKKEFYFISYKENLILQKYFTQSIKNSFYLWDENKIEKIETLIDKNKTYKSPVSSNLITAFPEKIIWIFITITTCSVIIINLIFSFKGKNLLIDRTY